MRHHPCWSVGVRKEVTESPVNPEIWPATDVNGWGFLKAEIGRPELADDVLTIWPCLASGRSAITRPACFQKALELSHYREVGRRRGRKCCGECPDSNQGAKLNMEVG